MNEFVSQTWLDARSWVSARLDMYLVSLRKSGNLVGTLKDASGPGGPYVEFINSVADVMTRREVKAIAVVGSRSWTDQKTMERWFRTYWNSKLHLVTGGASGADQQAIGLATRTGDVPTVFRPDFVRWPANEFGKDYAPKMRNRQVVDAADIVVAFWDGRSTGTSHAVCYALSTGKTVEVVLEDPLQLPRVKAGP